MDKRIVVAIDTWEVDSPYPRGHYVKTLGDIGERETETDVLLLEHDIPTLPFTAAVQACLPPLPWSVTQADVDDPSRYESWAAYVCVQLFSFFPCLQECRFCSTSTPATHDIDKGTFCGVITDNR